jgi:hypothetical protein
MIMEFSPLLQLRDISRRFAVGNKKRAICLLASNSRQNSALTRRSPLSVQNTMRNQAERLSPKEKEFKKK